MGKSKKLKLGEKRLLVTTSKGVKLYDTWVTGTYKGYRIVLAEFPDNKKTFLVLEKNKKGMKPIYENQNYEDVCIHIDILEKIKEKD